MRRKQFVPSFHSSVSYINLLPACPSSCFHIPVTHQSYCHSVHFCSSFSFMLKLFTHSCSSIPLVLHVLPSFLPYSFCSPFIFLSYYHSSLRILVMINDILAFPQIVGTVQCVFPEHKRDWVHRFFSCPFVNNKQFHTWRILFFILMSIRFIWHIGVWFVPYFSPEPSRRGWGI